MKSTATLRRPRMFTLVDGEPVETDDSLIAEHCLADIPGRRVAFTRITSASGVRIWVATTFMVYDHATDPKRGPILWETRCEGDFGEIDGGEGPITRYATRALAEQGHRATVAGCLWGLDEPAIIEEKRP